MTEAQLIHEGWADWPSTNAVYVEMDRFAAVGYIPTREDIDAYQRQTAASFGVPRALLGR